MQLRPFQNRETWSLTEAMAPSMQVCGEVWRSSQADSQTTKHGRLCCRYHLVRDGKRQRQWLTHCRPKEASHVESGQYGDEVDPVPCQYDPGFADRVHGYQP